MTNPSQEQLAAARNLIREIPDYPEPGVLFRDISPLLADGTALRTVVDAMLAAVPGGGAGLDAVVGVEARGFLLASAAAYASGAGLLVVRKAGKLPTPHDAESYSLEYGEARVEIQHELPAGARVLVVDDVLATGGTLAATLELLRRAGYEPVAVSVLFELEELAGREKLGDVPVNALFK